MASAFLSNLSISLAKLNSLHRFLVSLFIAIPSYFLFIWLGIKPVTGLMMSWDLFSLMLIIMIAIIFFNIPKSNMRFLAQREDESRTITFFIVLISVLISLFGIVLLLKNDSKELITENLHEPISMIGVALSWLLLHSIFTLHYAHLFYDDDDQKTGICSGGLDFPDEKNPDYLDFAYFSFVIGMTFQVSDVNITAKKIRRLALLHGIIAFLFNTIIVALTISIIASLK